MVQEHIALLQRAPDVPRSLGQRPLPRLKWFEFQIRAIHRAVQMHQTRQIHRPLGAIDLPVSQLEDPLQPRNYVGAHVGFDFQAHGVALAPVVQLRAHRLQHRARLFFLQIKIAVAGNAERTLAQNFIASIHPSGVQPDQVGKRNEGIAIRIRQPHQPRQGTRHRYHSHVVYVGGRPPPPSQQQRLAQCLVNHPRKRMRRIDGHRGQQGIQFVAAVIVHHLALGIVQIRQRMHPDAMFGQRRQQLLVPAFVLLANELVRRLGQHLLLVQRSQPVGSGIHLAFFQMLQQSGYANLKELVQVTGRDRQELHPLQQRVALVFSFLQNPAIEGEPRHASIQVELRAEQRARRHSIPVYCLAQGNSHYRTVNSLPWAGGCQRAFLVLGMFMAQVRRGMLVRNSLVPVPVRVDEVR